ncbi:MAG: class I SAM-dependent DNA methyltransferase [Alcaligenaceae bacterium]|nr:class I SAM-dependent DNA methyltransferase [Alcaligenaceae bacterium]
MPVLEAVQTFTGITNENEFYSHHYLAEVFKGDIKARLDAWDALETEHAGEENQRAPYKRLQAWAQKWFSLHSQIQHAGDDKQRWKLFTEIQTGLLEALGYPKPTALPHRHELVAGLPIPLWLLQLPGLAVIPAYRPGAEDDDLLDHTLPGFLYGEEPVPNGLKGETWADMLADAVFAAETAPRYVVLAGLDEWLLIDRYKWPNNRALRFDWAEILDRKDADTLKACAVLLHKESLAPGEGDSLLQSLDENAHKHAFGVSEDLKYALREAIELLGNEAARQLRQQAADSKKGFFSGKDQLDPDELSMECLRMVYRLLFMFYIEARPELSYVPIAKSEVYQKGYSLESLRDLEMQPLTTPSAREGAYFDTTLRRLFQLVAEGCGLNEPRQGELGATITGAKDVFALAPLDSRLFDDDSMPLLNRVRFPNHVWQRIIRLMSLTRGQGRGKRSGRVSYQLLSINQLGAVYEALLSYRGFFASEDLYEVQPAPKKAKAAAPSADDDDSDEPTDDDDSPRKSSGAAAASGDLLENAWFVPADRLHEYDEAERVYDKNDAGHLVLRKHERGKFVYRLAGRDRQKSASYYTPQVLTQCLVKYALKELLEGGRVKKADDILTLTVCEPAMGSAAFLNEAVNQLSEAYLERKQAELGRRIPHEDYPQELQKVRMYMADRNVYGVDLNPVAVELAEVSLWLNAIYGETDEEGRPQPARVPWFGYQLFAGNSLIGARHQVYRASSLLKGAKPAWHAEPPRPVTAEQPRAADEIWHFLLPDPGMANYTDKTAKALYPEAFERLKAWRKAFTAPLSEYEIARLQQLSNRVQELWQEHTRALARDRQRTEDNLTVWPHPESDAGDTGTRISRAQKEVIRREGLLNEDGDLATPFRRLKLVMDYWCALWFWPLAAVEQIPSREEWWMEIGAILEGNVVDMTPQLGLGLEPAAGPIQRDIAEPTGFEAAQPSLEGFATQPSLRAATEDRSRLHDTLGQLRIGKLRHNFPRIAQVEAVADARRFMHWELFFADILLQRGGFDLILGNPPWLKVEWNESGILGEYNPIFAVRKISASDLAKLRREAFAEFSGLQEAWAEELQEAEGMQSFLNAVQNYPLLKGVQSNLYKNFVERSWQLSNSCGCIGLIHEESLYDDAAASNIRENLYRRLRYHFQFVNEKKLFKDVDNHKKFSINITSSFAGEPAFINISNLYHPSTVDKCFDSDNACLVPSIKDSKGDWNVEGHPSRAVRIDRDRLELFFSLFDNGIGSTLGARLPAVHSEEFVSVLSKFNGLDSSFEKLDGKYGFFEMYHETRANASGVIAPNIHTPKHLSDVVLSGSHIGIGNAFQQTSHSAGGSKMAFDRIDLELIGANYLPRTKFCLKDHSINGFKKSVNWNAALASTKLYRFATKYQISQSMERGYVGCVIPPGVSHLQTIISVAFKDDMDLVNFSCRNITLLYAFFARTTGFPTFRSLAKGLRWKGVVNPRLISRFLLLVCVTDAYADLWQKYRQFVESSDSWAIRDRKLTSSKFEAFTHEWEWSSPARKDFDRRQLLVEMDVLVAMEMEVTLEEFLSIYRVQFPVMHGFERDTWYDINGRIIFTNNKGLTGVGLPRKGGRNTPRVRIQTPDGNPREGNFGWEDLYKDSEWLVPDGTVVTEEVMDDTLPGGPRKIERRYVAPFARADREEDYRIAWAYFSANR